MSKDVRRNKKIVYFSLVFSHRFIRKIVTVYFILKKNKMLEININFQTLRHAETTIFHLQKDKYQHAIQHTEHKYFQPMALEKPTREKRVKERDFTIRKFTAKLRNFKTNLSQPGRENFCLVFCAKQEKSNSYFFFFCFLPRFLCLYIDCTVQTNCTDLEIRGQEFFSLKIVPRNLPQKLCKLLWKPYCTDYTDQK